MLGGAEGEDGKRLVWFVSCVHEDVRCRGTQGQELGSYYLAAGYMARSWSTSKQEADALLEGAHASRDKKYARTARRFNKTRAKSCSVYDAARV